MQQINLLVDDLKPAWQPLQRHHVAIAGCLWLLALLLWSGVDLWRLSAMAGERETLTAQRAALLAESERVAVAAGSDDAAELVRQAEVLRRELLAGQAFLKGLAAQETTANEGFSKLLEDLARSHQPGLWLTGFTLNERQLSLHGETVAAEHLPRFLHALAATSSFAGQRFERYELNKVERHDNSELLSFRLVGPMTGERR